MAIWRGLSAGIFSVSVLRWPSATSGQDRAASGAPDALCHSLPFRGAPAWQLRSWLLLYDRLASRNPLPPSATLDVTHHPVGNALKRPFGTAFEYSDCVVDDSSPGGAHRRRRRGARRGDPHRRALRRAERGEEWRLVTKDRGFRKVITAQGGRQRGRGLDGVRRRNRVARAAAEGRRRPDEPDRRPPPVRLRQRLCVPEQRRTADLTSPYERDFTLIGTASHAFKGDPAIVAMAASDVAYLCDAARPLFPRTDRGDRRGAHAFRRQHGDEAREPADRSGTAAMTLDHGRDKAPLITIFGDDVTTSRLRAEKAVTKLTPFYPMSARWTAKSPLPGGDFALEPLRPRGRRGARALAVPRRGPGAAAGRRLRLGTPRQSSATPSWPRSGTSARPSDRN